jgi:hypothetical protein
VSLSNKNLLNEKRQALYDSGERRSKSIILEIKKGNKLVDETSR